MKKISTLTFFLAIILQSLFAQSELTRDQQAASKGEAVNFTFTNARISDTRAFVSGINSACDTISTTFQSNNGLDGVMFNVIAHTDVFINFFYANINSGNVRIYFKQGSFIGFENDSMGWTNLGDATVTGISGDTTLIPININQVIPAGDTAGFYLTFTNAGSVRYTDSPTGDEGDVYVDNGEIAVTLGSGKSFPFDFTIGPRIFNGIVDYCLGTTSGISETEEASVSVYPNPFNESATFVFDNHNVRRMKIFNITGSMVKEMEVAGSEFTFNRGELTEGIYTYQITTGDGMITSGRFMINQILRK